MANTSTTISELAGIARAMLQKNAEAQKTAAVDAQTLAQGGGGGMPPGMDPAAMGGGMPPGMDPAAMGGGMPPMDPAAMSGAAAGPPPLSREEVQAMIQQAVQAGGGAGAGAGAAGLKPKIDVNVEIMQMKKLIARLCDAMGVHIPAQEMVATPGDLTQMAAQSQGAAAGGAAPTSAIAPPSPIQPAMPTGGGGGEKSGEACETGEAVALAAGHQRLQSKAAALAAVMSRRAAFKVED